MRSGYKTITPTQLANVLAALDVGTVGLRELRVYFACFALVAVREAARRYRRRRREAPKEQARYRLAEFQEITGLRSIVIKSRLPLQSDCNHSISLNAFSSSFLSVARPISDFAYRVASLTLDILF